MFRISDRVPCSAEKEVLAAKLKREQDEVSTLKTQLAKITESHKAEMDHVASEKTRLEEEMQKLRDAADTAEKKADLAQEAARQFQARIDAWTAEFKKVQENMHGEFLFRVIFFESSRVTFSESLTAAVSSSLQQTSLNLLLALLQPWPSFGKEEKNRCHSLWLIGKLRTISSPSLIESSP